MLEDLKKIEDNWREMDEFAAFSKKLLTMTNSIQKKLKEDMATSSLKKIASQVRKHNKRYLLTKHLVRGVFAEWETGQAVAQLLKGGNEEMSALSKPFFRNSTSERLTVRSLQDSFETKLHLPCSINFEPTQPFNCTVKQSIK
jgi:hypothetical protein